MRQALHLEMQPSLKLTQHLQQAIQLLQLSSIELQQEVQRQIESNPLLEESNEEELSEDESDFGYQYRPFHEPLAQNDPLISTSENLQDHLRWQLELTAMSETDHAIALVLIDAINEDGFITCSKDAILQTLQDKKHPIHYDEIEAVRHRIQQFEPVGCAVYSLAETLLVQLGQFPKTSKPTQLAIDIIRHHMDKLCKHEYQRLLSLYNIRDHQLSQALSLIQHLNPRPGSLFQQALPTPISPDLCVRKINSKWKVTLNSDMLVHVSINHTYASMLQMNHHAYLKHQLSEAKWFIKSIQNRQETLLKVAKFIVNYQKEFLDFGEEAMKPLTLNDVAQALNMHESTISRVTTQKFISTPRGMFELRYFFSNHLKTEIGEGCSSVAIRAFIKKLIRSEDHRLPLSDHQIAMLMGCQGVHIARRTVTKYRESMHIASSSERKWFHQ